MMKTLFFLECNGSTTDKPDFSAEYIGGDCEFKTEKAAIRAIELLREMPEYKTSVFRILECVHRKGFVHGEVMNTEYDYPPGYGYED